MDTFIPEKKMPTNLDLNLSACNSKELGNNVCSHIIIFITQLTRRFVNQFKFTESNATVIGKSIKKLMSDIRYNAYESDFNFRTHVMYKRIFSIFIRC